MQAFDPGAFGTAFQTTTSSAGTTAFDPGAFGNGFLGGSNPSGGSAFDPGAFDSAFNGGAPDVVTPPSTGNLVDHIDYVNKRIYLSALTVDATIDTMDIYREIRTRRRLYDADRLFKPIIIGGGGIPKIPGVSYTPTYVQLLHGCRIVPYGGVSHKLKIVRDTFTDDGKVGRDCFDRTSLPPGIVVDIDIDFPEIEIRTVTVQGASGASAAEVWSYILTASNPAHGSAAEKLLQTLNVPKFLALK